MPLFIAFIVFLGVMLAVAAAGLKLWVRPKEAIERVTGMESSMSEKIPLHPSLVFHDLIKRLGALVPTSPKDASVMQRRMIRAGIRSQNAVTILYGAKIVFGVLAPVLMSFAVAKSDADSANKIIAVLAAAAMGFFGPNEYVKIRSQRRQKGVQKGLANALDLLVVCVESGLGLDQAMVQVAKELEHAHREIAEEFAMVNLELKAGKRRVEALRNLADR
ncbi:MAG TPA: type II secretion system F family protein, partial [Hyphomonas sp.]|nr:type II secretion system F family protein [Hyphomonas sp.]